MWKTFKNKCGGLVKSLFIAEPIETSPIRKEDPEKLLLIRKIERLEKEEGLVDLMRDEVVKTYLMSTYTSTIKELLEPIGASLNNTLDPVSAGVYFQGDGENIYYYLRLIKKLLNKTTSAKQINDIEEIVGLFYFYKGDDNGNE